jgi:hypothetical protein
MTVFHLLPPLGYIRKPSRPPLSFQSRHHSFITFIRILPCGDEANLMVVLLKAVKE